MKKIIIIVFILVKTILYAKDMVPIQDSDFNFVNSIQASNILNEEDDFISRLSNFDISARMKSSSNITKEEYLRFISQQTLSWENNEIERIDKIIQDIKSMIGKYNLLFPETITLIKTTGLEEGNASYCRSNSSIIIASKDLARSDDDFEELLIHELFHIFSRNNLSIQEKLYSIVGFKKCEEVILPENLNNWRITNPDASKMDYYFTSTINKEEVKLIPILLAGKAYDESQGGEFFDYMNFLFIGVDVTNDKVEPKIINNKYYIVSIKNVENYFDLIGENTDYIIHPEEVLADNFVLLIKDSNAIKTPKIIDQMKHVFE